MKLSDPKDIACYDLLSGFARALLNPFHSWNATLALVVNQGIKRAFVFDGKVVEIRPMPNNEVGVFLDPELGYLRITVKPFTISYAHSLLIEPDGSGVAVFYDATENPRTPAQAPAQAL